MAEPDMQSVPSRSIGPEDVMRFAPGQVVAEADIRDPAGRMFFFRNIEYGASTVSAPGMDSMLIVVYRHGETLMRRRVDRGWQESDIKPGHISLLGSDRSSDWEWDTSIGVSHFYLSSELLSRMALSAFDSEYRHFHALDELSVQDPSMLALADALDCELHKQEPGSRLLTDLVAQALALQVLKNHHVSERTGAAFADAGTALTPAQRRRVLDFVEANLARNFGLPDLAHAAGLCEHAFPRRFKASFELSPWQFVLQRRVQRAAALISDTRLPLAEIAFRTGFSDQAHMTRIMKKLTGNTPGNLRRG